MSKLKLLLGAFIILTCLFAIMTGNALVAEGDAGPEKPAAQPAEETGKEKKEVPGATGFSPFRFSVLGDNRPHGDPEKIIQPEIFKKAIEEINLLDPDFTVIPGDLILGYDNDEELIGKEWDEFLKTCEKFAKPYYSVVGNHDVWDKWSEEIWKKRFGPLYYAFSHKGCRFICLNSEDTDKRLHIYGEQLEWLKKELEEHKDSKHIFVFLHFPLWRGIPAEYTNWMSEVHPLLAKYKVNTVFAGHYHRYELSDEIDGVRYLIVGGAGAEIGKNPFRGDFFHHLFVTVVEDKVQVAVIKTGSIFPQEVVTQEQVEKTTEFTKSILFEPVSVALGNSTLVSVRAAPKNTFDNDITVEISLDLTNCTGWTCAEPHRKVIIKPGESRELTFQISFNGETLFPLPQTRIECSMGGEKILEWEWVLGLKLDRALEVAKTEEKIAIDGKLDEECWKQAEPAGKWMTVDGSRWAHRKTNLLASYDNNSLYLAFNCREDNMSAIRQVSKERDWRGLTDDCVIFYLAPVRDGKSRFCLAVTSFGSKMDYEAPAGKVDFTWNPEWQVGISKGKDGYTIEVAVPFRILDTQPPAPGAEWGINAFRLSTPGKSELSGWNLPSERLSNPEGYGTAIFK